MYTLLLSGTHNKRRFIHFNMGKILQICILSNTIKNPNILVLCLPVGGPVFPTKNAYIEQLLSLNFSLLSTVYETAMLWNNQQ